LKLFSFLFMSLLFSQFSLAQQATNFFPNENGYKWYYKTTMLDSLNQPVDSFAVYTVDSLVGEMTYNGKQAKYFVGKTGALPTIFEQPYLDTSWVALSGNDGSIYFGLGTLSSLLGILDPSVIDSSLGGFVGLLSSVQGWYSAYKFTNPVNSSYTLFTKDTTISYSGTDYPIRFQVKAQRKNDEVVSTPVGSFTCKRFLLNYAVSYMLLGVIPVPIISIDDNHYIAEGKWLVKQIALSTTIDLSFAQLGTFTIPGREVIIQPEFTPPTSVFEGNVAAPAKFNLMQNYPNPFNPTTVIRFTMPNSGYAKGMVYDLLGREIAVLLDGEMAAGNHSLNFNAVGLPSGIYLFRLNAEGGYSSEIKMILNK